MPKPTWKDWVFGFGNPLHKSGRENLKNFLFGNPEKKENVSLLREYQEPLHQQSVNAAMGPGAGGAFGTSADYYRDLLSDNPQDLQAFAAPELRRFNEQIAPDLAEQYAGMGAGGLSSSGFNNSLAQGAVDLQERLGAIRANLRQSAAQGLYNIGQQGLVPYAQNMTTQEGSGGAIQPLAQAAGTAAGAYLGGPMGGAAGYQAGNTLGSWFNGRGNRVGANTSPYGQGNGVQSSPVIQRT